MWPELLRTRISGSSRVFRIEELVEIFKPKSGPSEVLDSPR